MKKNKEIDDLWKTYGNLNKLAVAGVMGIIEPVGFNATLFIQSEIPVQRNQSDEEYYRENFPTIETFGKAMALMAYDDRVIFITWVVKLMSDIAAKINLTTKEEK